MTQINPISTTLRQTIKENLTPGNEHIRALQKQSLQLLESQGLPHRRLEDWKYTRIEKHLAKNQYLSDDKTNNNNDREAEYQKASFVELEDYFELVFIDNQFYSQFSNFDKQALELTPLEQITDEQLKPFKSQVGDETHDSMYHLNQAMLKSGFLLTLKKQYQDTVRIHIKHFSSSGSQAFQWQKFFIVTQDNHKLTLAQSFIGSENAHYFNHSNIDFYVAPNATVEHYKIQQESFHAVHLSHLRAFIQRDAHFESNNIQLGAQVTRQNISLLLEGCAAHSKVLSLACSKDKQHFDNKSFIRHKHPHTHSEQLQKNILDQQSKSIFTGRILVDQDAQQINASQLNKNLILNSKAQAYGLPQLEINADDVKCSHGCTTGQLSDDELFYIKSRGIKEQRAKKILTKAFGRDVLIRLKDKTLQQYYGEQLEVNFESQVLGNKNV